MARKIIAIVVAVIVLWFGYAAYMNWRKSNSMANGEITSADEATKPMPVSSDPPAKPNTVAATTTAAPSSGTQPIVIPSSVPSTDSQQPNAANGVRFAGSGKYQVYRQGNLTYRIDTETGQECVLLATEEEWRKPQVYSRGCGTK